MTGEHDALTSGQRDGQLSLYLHLELARVKPQRLQSHAQNLTGLIKAVEHRQHVSNADAAASSVSRTGGGSRAEVDKPAIAKRSRWEDSDDESDERPASKTLKTTTSPSKPTTITKTKETKSPPETESHPTTEAVADVSNKGQARSSSRALPSGDGCRSVFLYERVKKIDEGTYGIVFRARNKENGEEVALKQVKLNGFPITALREMNILQALDHNSVVRVREMVAEELDNEAFNVFMVMDLYPHDLRTVLRRLSSSKNAETNGSNEQSVGSAFNVAEAKCVMQQLLSALAHIHSNWFFHRDIKTANVLYDNGHVALADFGMARKFDEPLRKYTQLVVTLHYRAPELLMGAETYSPAVDMWSMGCLFAELLTGTSLMPGQGEVDQLTRIVKLRGRPNPAHWPEVVKLPHWGMLAMTPSKQATSLAAMFTRKNVRTAADGPFLCDKGLDLLERILALNPANRLTAEEALAHPWFSAIPLPRALSDMPPGLE